MHIKKYVVYLLCVYGVILDQIFKQRKNEQFQKMKKLETIRVSAKKIGYRI
jgi:hypothetical protein